MSLINLSYRARRRLVRLGYVLLGLVLVAIVVWLIWMLWLSHHVVYTRDGAYLDFSLSSRDLEGEVAQPKPPAQEVSIYFNEGENTLQTTAELTQMYGYYIDGDMLSKDFDGVLRTLRRLPAGTPVLLEVKDVMGRFYYTTSLGTNRKDIDPARVDALINELVHGDLYAIARFPAFREYLWAVDNVNYGLSSTKGAYLFLDSQSPDGNRCYWLDPTKNGTMDFVMAQLTEIKEKGFDEVVLADFRFPDSTEYRFAGDKTQVLISTAKSLASTYASNRFTLSFEVTDMAFTLPEGRTRMYMTGITAEEAKNVAESTTVTDKMINLVFTTPLLDTRFDGYSVLRPITSARIEEQ